MRKTLASITSTGAAPWKFLLLAATLLFSYAIPAHADDHEEDNYDANDQEKAGDKARNQHRGMRADKGHDTEKED